MRRAGGSVVWVLVPPLVRAAPLVDEQAAAVAAAMRAFATATSRGGTGGSRH
jgi:hypothetical protein